MNELKRVYYPLPMVADKLQCSVVDVLHLGATNRLEICAYIDDIQESEDYFSFNVFFDKEDDYIEEINQNNSIITDLYEIALFNYNESTYVDENQKLKFKSWYANHLRGFFAIPSELLIDIELSNLDEDFRINARELYTPKIFGKTINISNIEGLYIPENKLIVLDGELSGFNFGAKAKYPGSEKDTPKTIAKKSQLIPVLLKLIPEISDLDLDSVAVSKIISIVETLASQKGIDLPATDKNTWARYLGRK
ncbi:conserved hypothetical protein [Enterobacterales bacterium 8AC]|nr:conserved hypothetical protein [Enterobacterales bacterium 8AC]